MSKAMFALTLSVAVALASAACNPGADFDDRTGAACPKQRQASISTDRRGNINVNTAVNGDVRVVRREETSISIKDMIDDIAGNKKNIGEMQKNAALYTSAQGFMTSLAKDTMSTTKAIEVEQVKQALNLKRVLDDVAGIETKIDRTVDALKKDVAKSLQDGEAKAAASAKQAAAAAKKDSDTLKKSVDDALKPVKTLGTTVAAIAKSPAVSVLYKRYPTFQLFEWQKTKNQRQDGRVFYKVDYNPTAPGWYQCDRREFKQACKDLSALLKSRDGKDRALKPACDQGRCDSSGVDLPGSYLSNMGCGSRPRSNHGYGLKVSMVQGTGMYNRQNSWSGCGILVNYGSTCDHAWARQNHGSTQKALTTLCTGSNGLFKEGPV